MAASLTDAVVQNLRPKRGQAGWRDVSDGACRGLCLRISPQGEKAWGMRLKVAGHRLFKTLGGYPAVGLAEARNRAREYLSGARDGISPEEMDAAKKAETMTLAMAHPDYLRAMGPTLRAQTVRLKRDMFSQHIAPKIGPRLVGSVRKLDVVTAVESVVAKGFPAQANRVYSEIMALLRWCEQKGYVTGVPNLRRQDLRKVGAAREVPRDRTLTSVEIKVLWALVEKSGGLTCDFTKLLLLTGQRSSEVRQMRWEEVNMVEKIWIIPASRYKTHKDQVVPLSEPVMDILRARWSDGITGYVLAGTKPGKPFNGQAGTMLRIREKFTKQKLGSPDFTWHDLRRTVRSGLSRLGVDDRTAEMVIGHMPQGVVRTYDRYDRLEERRAALQKWADWILSLSSSESSLANLHLRKWDRSFTRPTQDALS